MKTLLLIVFTALSVITYAQDSTALQVSLTPKYYVGIPTPEGSSLRLTGDWTIEAWINVPSNAGPSEIHLVETYSAPSTGGFVLRLTNLRLRALQMAGSSSYTDLSASETIPKGQWVHVAATMDETNDELIIYMDGVEVGSKSSTISTSNINANLYIGARGDDQDVNQDIAMDEVRIWGVAKSAAEIEAGMRACLEGNEPNLVAHYDFEDVTSATVVDKSGNNNDGTIANYSVDALTDGAYFCGNVTALEGDQTFGDDATVIKAYNLKGKEVSPNTRGELIILEYSNGKRAKTFIY